MLVLLVLVRTQAYAGLDFLNEWRWMNEEKERNEQKGGGIGLTMVGVRRSSCRPSPPRITVLPVSIITTLESRKPMLFMLIVFGVVG